MGRLEQQQRFVDESNQVDPIPDDISITELAEDVVRGRRALYSGSRFRYPLNKVKGC